MNISQYVFFYGSLREGGTNHSKLQNEPNIRKIGNGVTEDKYSFLGAMSGAYPYASHYVFEDVAKVNILGEVYEIRAQSLLQYFDAFEYNYVREIVSVIVDGKKYHANMYVVQDKELLDGVKQNLYPNGNKRFYNISTGDWFQKKKI
jgi:gamma-glutamylcyclotransferase (GGCT)/AIG2-like uncharacterized protein YtfP